MFGLFKKKIPPILKPEMLQPADAPISLTDAKRIFGEWMLKIGHLSDKEEASEHVIYLVEAISERADELKEEYVSQKEIASETLRDLRLELSDLKKGLKLASSEEEKCEFHDAISNVEREIASPNSAINAAAEALAAFKNDKRAFLVDYINTQVHGNNWRCKA